LVMSEHTIVGEHRNADIDMDRLLAEVAGQPLRGAA
jgi:simple sugar transport system ATP-binding protein